MNVDSKHQAVLQALTAIRWEYHQKYILPEMLGQIKRHSHLMLWDWWREYGAFTATLPRQSGKTQLIKNITDELTRRKEAFLVIALNSSSEKQLRLRGIKYTTNADRLKREVDGIPATESSQTHLFFDEYAKIEKPIVDLILNKWWKSVNIFGSF